MKRLIPIVIIFSLTLIYFGCRKDEDPVPVVDTTPPTAVEDVKNELVLNKDKTIIDTLKLSWEPSVDASGVIKYKVDLLMYDENGIPKKIRSVESDIPNASFVALSNNKDYKVEVQTIDGSGNTSSTVLKELNPTINAITSTINQNNLSLKWPSGKENDNDKVEYKIELVQYETDPDKGQVLVSKSVDTNEFSFTEYNNSKNYLIKVSINNSTLQEIQIKEIIVDPNTVTTSIENKAHSIRYSKTLNSSNTQIIDELSISWQTTINKEIDYVIKLYMYNDSGIKEVRSQTTKETFVLFNTLSNTKNYRVEVISKDSQGNFSNALVKEIKENDTSIIYAAAENELTVIWEKSDIQIDDIEYEIVFYEISFLDGSLTKVHSKTSNSDNYVYRSYSKSKQYQVEIITKNKTTGTNKVQQKIVSARVLPPAKNLILDRVLDPSNNKVIDEFIASIDYKHYIALDDNELLRYQIELFYFDEHNRMKEMTRVIHDSPNYNYVKRTVNDRNYHVVAYAMIGSYCPEDRWWGFCNKTGQSEIQKLDVNSNFIKAPTNLEFTREINTSDVSKLDKLNLTWKHDLLNIKDPNIIYNIDLFELDESNKLTKIKSTQVDNITSCSFENLSNLTKFQVQIRTENANNTIDLYNPKEVNFKIEKYNDNTNPTSISGFDYTTKLNSLTARWNESTDSSNQIIYDVTIHYMRHVEIDWYCTGGCGNDTTIERTAIKTISTKENSITFNDLILEEREYVISIRARDVFGNLGNEYFSPKIRLKNIHVIPIGIYDGDIILSTQKEVDAFIDHQLHTINGNVHITTADFLENIHGTRTWLEEGITNLNIFFEGIKEIKGNLIVDNYNTNHNYNFDAFDTLEKVHGDINLNHVMNFNALNLLTIGGSLKITGEEANYFNISFTGFKNLESLQGDLILAWGGGIWDVAFQGFNKLQSLPNDLILGSHVILSMPQLKNVSGNIYVKDKLNYDYNLINTNTLTVGGSIIFQ